MFFGRLFRTERQKRQSAVGVGVAMGVGLGLALDSILLGISFGILIGTGLVKLPAPRTRVSRKPRPR